MKIKIDILPIDYICLLDKLNELQNNGYELCKVRNKNFYFEQTNRHLTYHIKFSKSENILNEEFVDIYKNSMFIFKTSDNNSLEESISKTKKSLNHSSKIKNTLLTYRLIITVLCLFLLLLLVLNFDFLIKFILLIALLIALFGSFNVLQVIKNLQNNEVKHHFKSSYSIICFNISAILTTVAFLIYFDFSTITMVLLLLLESSLFILF